MTAFRQVITKLQEQQRQEALIALDFVLRLDPQFTPGVALQKQLQSEDGAVDLGEIVSLLQGSSETDADGLLVEAVDDFNARSFVDAREKVQRVLMDIPGHAEARELLKQIDEALEKETLIGDLLARFREAMDGGNVQQAAELVMDAQALDPHHPGIHAALEELEPQVSVEAEPEPPSSEPPAVAEEADDAGFATIAGDSADLQFAFEPAGSPEEAVEAPEAAPAFDADFSDPPIGAEIGSGDDFDPWSTSGDDEVSLGADTGEEAAPDGEGAPLFEPELGADVADLFSEDSDVVPVSEVAQEGDGQAPGEVTELLEQGQAAFDRGDDQAAIDAWSRIYLIDPGNLEAAERIDRARQRSEETERRLEAAVAEAREASERGEIETAIGLIDEVLAERADHLEAVELKERLEGGATAPTPDRAASAPALPELDESLFEEGPLPVEEEPARSRVEREMEELEEPQPEPSRPSRTLPWRQIAAGVGGLVVILVGVWVGSQYLSSRSDDANVAAVTRLLDQAEDLYRSGRIEEAVHLLQQFNTSSELDQQRIDLRLKKYQDALAPPTPTPIPAAIGEAERLMEQGQLLAAYAAVQEGLEAHPRDATLDQLRSEIVRAEPKVVSLHRAMSSGEWGVAASVARDLSESHPSSREYAAALRRSLFNASLAELRVYSLTGAEGYLRQLKRLEPDDEEVDRILDFIDKYKARPVDMQLKIFIGSLSPR